MRDHMHAFSAVVLAAGASRRFGDADKLRAEIGGKPVLDHVLEGLANLGLGEIVVVPRVPSEPVPAGIPLIVNPHADEGMGTSLALGISTLKPTYGAFVVMGDMPLILPELYRDMADALPGVDVVVPVHDGQPGHPVLFAADCFDALTQLSGDIGGRDLLRSGRYKIRFIEAGPFIHADIDTPQDLERLRSSGSQTA